MTRAGERFLTFVFPGRCSRTSSAGSVTEVPRRIVNNNRNTEALFETKEEIRAIRHRIRRTTGAYQEGTVKFQQKLRCGHAIAFRSQRKSPAPRPGSDAFFDVIGLIAFCCTDVQ